MSIEKQLLTITEDNATIRINSLRGILQLQNFNRLNESKYA